MRRWCLTCDETALGRTETPGSASGDLLAGGWSHGAYPRGTAPTGGALDVHLCKTPRAALRYPIEGVSLDPANIRTLGIRSEDPHDHTVTGTPDQRGVPPRLLGDLLNAKRRVVRHVSPMGTP